jgi:hypothetical protein
MLYAQLKFEPRLLLIFKSQCLIKYLWHFFQKKKRDVCISFKYHPKVKLTQFEEETERFCLTLKNVIVDPLSRVPYEISVCPAKSSAFSIGVIIRSTVRKAARLAV